MKGVKFKENTMLVSQTDVTGKIIYANVDFCKTSGYSFGELVGQSHNIIRHEDMPRVIFKLLWKKLQNGKSIYAFVKNKSKDGGHYWVKAFIAPIIKNGKIDRYVSYRTFIDDESSMKSVSKLYSIFYEYEKNHTVNESFEYFLKYLEERKLSYEDLIIRLTLGKQISNKVTLSIDFRSYFDDHIIFRTHIIRQVQLKSENIKVTKSCCCRFGKWLESVKNESYTNCSEWKNILVAHDDVHKKLQQYVDDSNKGVSDLHLQGLITSTEKDRHTIFDTLEYIVDKYEE